MATTLSNIPALEWVGTPGVEGPIVRDYAEGTGETFKKGDLVVYDVSEDGLVIAAQGDGGVYGDTGNDEVADNVFNLGIALKDATGTAGSLIPVLIPQSSDRFAAVIFATDNTTVTAPVGDDIGTLVDFIKADSNNGSKTGVLRGTAGLWARIVDVSPQDRSFRAGGVGAAEPTYSAGDRVIVQFQAAALTGKGSIA